MHLISFEESYCLSTENAKSTVKFALNDSLRGSAFTTQPNGFSGLQIEGNNWSLEHHVPARNTFMKLDKSVNANTKLTVSQAVPNNKWFLAPNPAFKLVHSNALGSNSITDLHWDTLTRMGGVSTKLYSGDDNSYKAELGMHSKLGLKMTARAKLRKGAVHSVAATVGNKTPAQLNLKSRFAGDSLKLDTSYVLGVNVMKFEAKRIGEKPVDGGPRTTTTMEALVPMGKTSGIEPRVIIGIKLHF
ncbi:hypothetical protein Ndes2526B_g00717 [Nannochloris sp. 'desiccata']